jgi:hypothetical protein
MLGLSLCGLPLRKLLPDQLFYGFTGRGVLFQTCLAKGEPERLVKIEIYSGHLPNLLWCVIA